MSVQTLASSAWRHPARLLPLLVPPLGNANLGYGQSAVSGDIDGDGDMDIVTGDPDFGSGAGRAYVFLNSPVE